MITFYVSLLDGTISVDEPVDVTFVEATFPNGMAATAALPLLRQVLEQVNKLTGPLPLAYKITIGTV